LKETKYLKEEVKYLTEKLEKSTNGNYIQKLERNFETLGDQNRKLKEQVANLEKFLNDWQSNDQTEAKRHYEAIAEIERKLATKNVELDQKNEENHFLNLELMIAKKDQQKKVNS
jgi:CII-binding regulator of phage lambda lysogenization HflD